MGLGDMLGGLLGTQSNFQASGGYNNLNKSLTEYDKTGLDAVNRQQNFLNALLNQNTLGNQQDVYGQQQTLANQLQQQAMGGGPNPALAQLANTTSQNIANQAALMAGQRGASQNPGLIARQAAQQGGALQQQAAGQAAAMRAQQQLNAQSQLQNQQAMMGNLATQQIAQQQQGINSLGGMGFEGQRVLTGMQQNMNNINAGIAQGNQQANKSLIGGVLGGIGGVLGLAHGGEVPPMQHLASGGPTLGVTQAPLMPGVLTPQMQAQPRFNLGLDYQMAGGPQIPQAPQGPGFNVDMGFGNLQNPYGDPLPTAGPKSKLAAFGKGFANAFNADQQNDPLMKGMQSFVQGASGSAKNYFRPGKDAVTAPIRQGGKETGEMALSKGGKVPGKPKVFGDNEKNDVVPAKLSPGEVVIPRSKIKDPKKVAEFINQVLGFNLKAGKA